ncbi:Pre-mRNA-splicing factor 38B [Bagarius yarrelli]|uniref:Pre-mRNA-splicing factor 38B n=1 Tax=Bagarius yarrelli TaxID=175774 RepID=A0A556V7J4_BAGYA|nr:Pre-mRNA-splicing factor 38B [Bagarius yarrelli]
MAGNQQQQAVSKPPSGKHGNVLPLWGNEKTMNLNPMILTNVLSSPYFKVQLYELKTYHEVVDEIYFKVTHAEPWEKGSRKTSGQTGMCGGVRGVGTGGIVSTAFCLLYKLFTLKLTRKQVMGLITHTDSPYIRALGFMYIRYTQPPADLIEWFEPFLDDEEELDVKAGGGCVMTVGEMLRSFLTKLEWFSTLFPRIPVPVQKNIDTQLKNRPRKPPQRDSKEVEESEEWHHSRPRRSPNRSRSRSHHRERRGASFDHELEREKDRQRKDRDRERDRMERERFADRNRDRERDRRHSQTPDQTSERRRSREKRYDRKERDGEGEKERSRRKERSQKECTSGTEREKERLKDKRAKGGDDWRAKDEREERRHREDRKNKRSKKSRSRERSHKGERSSRKRSRSHSRSRQEAEEKSRKHESSLSKEHIHKHSHSRERSHRSDASNGKDCTRTDIEGTP